MRRIILCLFLAVLAVLAIVAYARAHTAASGWAYPAECCSGRDCHEIDESDLTRNLDGSFTINATGEVFYDPDKAAAMMKRFAEPTNSYTPGMSVRAFRWSGDGAYHRCAKARDSGTYCLFVPMPAA